MTTAAECNTKHEAIDRQFERHDNRLDDLGQLAIPGWARALMISAILVSFGLYATAWAYNASVYCTKEEKRRLETDVRDMRKEIRQEIRDGFARIERDKTP